LDHCTGFTSEFRDITDPDGFLWVGTLNGLVRFDGLHFSGFERDGPPELQENVQKLARDNKDGVWIATITGLIHYAHGGFRAISIPGSPPAHIEALARGRMVVFGSSPETS